MNRKALVAAFLLAVAILAVVACDLTSTPPPPPTATEAYLALLKKHGVRYDLCGHDHRYRTAERDGIVLITTDGAGAPLYYPPEEGGFHHYVRFTVQGTDVHFEAVKVE